MAKDTINHSELGNFTFADIEDIYVIVKIKGKSYAIMPKNGRDKDAELNRRTAIYFMFDEHYVALPSIDETLEFKKSLLNAFAEAEKELEESNQ